MGNKPMILLNVEQPKQSELITALQSDGNVDPEGKNIDNHLTEILQKYSYFEGLYRITSPTEIVPINPTRIKECSTLTYYARMHFPESLSGINLNKYNVVPINISHMGAQHRAYIRRNERIFKSNPHACKIEGFRFDMDQVRITIN